MSPTWGFINIGVLIAAYLLGSIPTGYILGKVLKGIDIRDYGSHSIGATNVLRTLGKGPGLFVLLSDIGKGVLAIALAQFVASSELLANASAAISAVEWQPWLAILSGLMGVLGHSKPVWLNFQGGKSVAVGLGIILMLSWQTGLAAIAVFGLVLAISRMVSLGSICAAVSLPILMYGLKQPLAYILFSLMAGGYVIFRHRSNIQRILSGTEARLGDKAVQPPVESA